MRIKEREREKRGKMTLGLINANPVVHAKKERLPLRLDHDDAVDPLEIYDILRFLHFTLLSSILCMNFP